MAYGILTHCFLQHPSYLLQCTLPSSTFIKSFICFDFFFHKMFGRLLGPGSFDSLEGPLVGKQASLLITFDGFRLILTSTITLWAYLGSWTLVVLIIVVRFMVDQRPFLLEALSWVDNNTFPFQQHLKVACDLLPSPTYEMESWSWTICWPMNWSNGGKHHHTFSSMFFDRTSKVHCAWILSCSGPNATIDYNSISFPSLSIMMRSQVPS